MILNVGDEFIYSTAVGNKYKYIIVHIDSRYLHMEMYNLKTSSANPYKTAHEIQSFIDNINSGKVEIVYNLNLDFTIRHEEIL
jgi:hypothetical protein